jgi:hypothetical protein
MVRADIVLDGGAGARFTWCPPGGVGGVGVSDERGRP